MDIDAKTEERVFISKAPNLHNPSFLHFKLVHKLSPLLGEDILVEACPILEVQIRNPTVSIHHLHHQNLFGILLPLHSCLPHLLCTQQPLQLPLTLTWYEQSTQIRPHITRRDPLVYYPCRRLHPRPH
ncbi:hypothetical protein Scep_025496 [Stephania cephalantha]|uniref:Uncharacterized protein n=1 Tax=Stephania cephalantha TaxID=152367 RepID=A0AAP0ELN1_9MAGN